MFYETLKWTRFVFVYKVIADFSCIRSYFGSIYRAAGGVFLGIITPHTNHVQQNGVQVGLYANEEGSRSALAGANQ